MKRLFSLIVAALVIVSLTVFTLPTAHAEETSAVSAGVVVTNGANLNVRKGASTSSAIVSKLKNGTTVTLISSETGWWRVRYGADSYGYVSDRYISQINGSYETSVATNGGRLNVRSGAGTNYAVLDRLTSGTKVVVIGTVGDWKKILYNGTSMGYVSAAYLGSRGVKLAVPLYKQGDSRWGSIKLGTQGKTVKQIGCALTSLAMCETYRTGSPVYPSDLSKTLTFDQSGALYWPSNYLHNYGSDYLTTLKNLLDSGKPAIVCCRTASWGTHFVVVTGYKSDGALTADDFYINDPGSASRTTLAELLTAYPYFYKVVYYR